MNDSLILFALYALVYAAGIVTGLAWSAWPRDRALNPALPPTTEVWNDDGQVLAYGFCSQCGGGHIRKDTGLCAACHQAAQQRPLGDLASLRETSPLPAPSSDHPACTRCQGNLAVNPATGLCGDCEERAALDAAWAAMHKTHSASMLNR